MIRSATSGLIFRLPERQLVGLRDPALGVQLPPEGAVVPADQPDEAKVGLSERLPDSRGVGIMAVKEPEETRKASS